MKQLAFFMNPSRLCWKINYLRIVRPDLQCESPYFHGLWSFYLSNSNSLGCLQAVGKIRVSDTNEPYFSGVSSGRLLGNPTGTDARAALLVLADLELTACWISKAEWQGWAHKMS